MIHRNLFPKIKQIPGIRHIQVFATKAGIIKTDEDIQGVVLKGIGSDFDWSYFKSNMVDGSVFTVTDTGRTDKVIISKKISDMLRLKTGDSFAMHFVQDPPRMRKFTISGIYETSLEEFDKMYVFCDIGHIKRLNGWEDDQVSGFEIFIDDFDKLDADDTCSKGCHWLQDCWRMRQNSRSQISGQNIPRYLTGLIFRI